MTRTKTIRTSRLFSAALIGALVGWASLHGAAVHAASLPHSIRAVDHAPAIVQMTHPSAAAMPALRRLGFAAVAPTFNCSSVMAGCGGGGGGGGTGGGASGCNTSLELAQTKIFNHSATVGTVTLFENTCPTFPLIWAHTWDNYASSSFQATLNVPSGTPQGASSTCPFSGCSIDTPQITVVHGQQYQACGTVSAWWAGSFSACTNWTTPQ